MGRLVAASRAAAHTHWHGLHPAQRLIVSCALAVMAAVVGTYGLSGFVFGYLHFFVGEGFALLQGLPALAWGSHGVQRHRSTASVSGLPSHLEPHRRLCTIAVHLTLMDSK